MNLILMCYVLRIIEACDKILNCLRREGGGKSSAISCSNPGILSRTQRHPFRSQQKTDKKLVLTLKRKTFKKGEGLVTYIHKSFIIHKYHNHILSTLF